MESMVEERLLKKGDLVRVIEKSEPGIRRRDGGLGRVNRVILPSPSSSPSSSSRPRYDVDYILGGKLFNMLNNDDIQLTTADNEGLTELTNRNRRKRKPSETHSTMAHCSKSFDDSCGGDSSSSSKIIKRAVKGKIKRKNREGRESPSLSNNDNDNNNSSIIPSQSSAMYERHRREFEKSIDRLERMDGYGYFLGAPPSPTNDDNDDSTPPPESSVPFNFVVVREWLQKNRYVQDRVAREKQKRRRIYKKLKNDGRFADSLPDWDANARGGVTHEVGVNWKIFTGDVKSMCDAAIGRDPAGTNGGSGTLGHASSKIKDLMDTIFLKTAKRQIEEMDMDDIRNRLLPVIEDHNKEAAVQTSWRRQPFPERRYTRLTNSHAICDGLSVLDQIHAQRELCTDVDDSFVGIPYIYDSKSEDWMTEVHDTAGPRSRICDDVKTSNENVTRTPSDEIIRVCVHGIVETLLISVQDRVMTERGVLSQPEFLSGERKDVMEQPVWGIDCYTRKNILLALEPYVGIGFAVEFVEKWLLPAINGLPVDSASDMSVAARLLERGTSAADEDSDDEDAIRPSSILISKLRTAPPWVADCARQLRLTLSSLSSSNFRIHPKGHGSVTTRTIPANTFITYYRGEVYPAWRWGEKIDAIELTQRKLQLKPKLPDFYNMVLERPAFIDPKGYGVLFVDASRKAGLGSSFSHSCQPTCEVRVTSVNKNLSLAMTTMKKVEKGEELTFDYNAVTESINEYMSAVCLCGHEKCRGSFLHFATADCYQTVMERNSPISVWFASLVRAGRKKVMALDDEKVLERHGFGNVVFGAVSCSKKNENTDSDNENVNEWKKAVPIWLRTYIADVLKYVEYERRALPVAMVCDHFNKNNTLKDSNKTNTTKNSKNSKDSNHNLAKSQKKDPDNEILNDPSSDNKPIPGSRPPTSFTHFSKMQKNHFAKMITQNPSLMGKNVTLVQAIQRLASSKWKGMSEEEKSYWKRNAIKEWEKNGGKEKAKLEMERKKRCSVNNKGKKRKPQNDNNSVKDDVTCSTDDFTDIQDDVNMAQSSSSSTLIPPNQNTPNSISFQMADAEGRSAMEQRIQSLAQSLSRVGRILARHRTCSSDSQIHPPLIVVSDDTLVRYCWYHPCGIVKTLLKHAEFEPCVSPALYRGLKSIFNKYDELFQSQTTDRQNLTRALLDLRRCLLTAVKMGEEDVEKRRLFDKRREENKARQLVKKERALDDMRSSSSENDDMETKGANSASLIKAASRYDLGSSDYPYFGKHPCSSADDTSLETACLSDYFSSSEFSDLIETIPRQLQQAQPQSQHPQASSQQQQQPLTYLLGTTSLPPSEYSKRKYKLESAADVLLLYAHTSIFFTIEPYATVESTPIDVYARELGNEVKKHLVVGDKNKNKFTYNSDDDNTCDPNDVVATIARQYEGSYVFSQLLQWHNGGIGTGNDLPELLGCVMLPDITTCFEEKKISDYKEKVRPRLTEWIGDRTKRGNPWSGTLKDFFCSDRHKNAKIPASKLDEQGEETLFLGSPILDLLITGEDSNIKLIANALNSRKMIDSVAMHKSQSDSNSITSNLEDKKANGSTVHTPLEQLREKIDEGMPAQAVNNWVQCESCKKWRLLPWHVDVDVLPEQFYCKDNVWNPKGNTCDAEEDPWSAKEAPVIAVGEVGAGGEAGDIEGRREEGVDDFVVNKNDFVKGARFDVYRAKTNKYLEASVVDTDFDQSSNVESVKFHFIRLSNKCDEWIDANSNRIKPLHSHTVIKKNTTDSAGGTAKMTSSPSKPHISSTHDKNKAKHNKKRKKSPGKEEAVWTKNKKRALPKSHKNVIKTETKNGESKTNIVTMNQDKIQSKMTTMTTPKTDDDDSHHDDDTPKKTKKKKKKKKKKTTTSTTTSPSSTIFETKGSIHKQKRTKSDGNNPSSLSPSPRKKKKKKNSKQKRQDIVLAAPPIIPPDELTRRKKHLNDVVSPGSPTSSLEDFV